LHENVVDAVIDDIVTDAAITTDGRGELDLGTNAIGGRNEHGVVHLLERGHIEEPAERTDARKHGFVVSGFDRILHQLNRAIASVYIYT